MGCAARRGPAGLGSLLVTAFLGATLLGGCKFPIAEKANVGSKGLWVANGTNVIEYNPAQLTAGTSATAPHVSINSAVFGNPIGVAFDPNGNLWVLDAAGIVNSAATPALFEFSAAQLAALATDNAPGPVATITSSSLKSPRQAVIDTLGNAWITDTSSNAVLVYATSQLAQTGANKLAPVLLITSSQFNGPSGIAFDSSGDLWISNYGIPQNATDAFGGGTTIVEILATHVPAIPESGTTPSTVVSDATLTDENQASIQSPWALAFDSSGNLWSSNTATSTLVEFAPAQFMTGTPVPNVTITVHGASLDEPHGICFDDVGNLAVVNEAGSSANYGISIYKSSDLANGSVAPVTFINGQATTLHQPNGCMFGPVVQ